MTTENIDNAQLFAKSECEASITRIQVGEQVILLHRGMPFYSFSLHDPIARDVAIAAVLSLGWTLDATATLCGVSHGTVSGVRSRLNKGGMAAVIDHGRPGRPQVLVGAKLKKALEMAEAGARVPQIARTVGVSEPTVRMELRSRGLLGSPEQLSVPCVGARGQQGRSTPECQECDSHQESDPATIPEVSQKTAPVHDPEEEQPVEPFVAEATCSPESAIQPATLASSPPSLAPTVPAVPAVPASTQEDTTETLVAPQSTELQPGAILLSGPGEHPCRYAGLLLLCAAAIFIGVCDATDAANVARPKEAIYSAHQAILGQMAAWGAGYASLEALHERDARALGAVLGLERSPSVRTMHRAIGQMAAVFDAAVLVAELAKGLMRAFAPERMVFGIDGHFKEYCGDEPIDKGWNTKKRMAVKGLADIVQTDALGRIWYCECVGAGDKLSQHLIAFARMMRCIAVASGRGNLPIVLCFDRGGQDFDMFDELAAAEFYYIGYVPASVTLPALESIAPATDGVGEVLWKHKRLNHPARLLVERDGTAMVPVVTNLPTLVPADEVMRMLRKLRGAQENEFKAARAFAHIDQLVDRGGATHEPDRRLVANPQRTAFAEQLRTLEKRLDALQKERPTEQRSLSVIDQEIASVKEEMAALVRESRQTPTKVPRVQLEPTAQRAELDVTYRLLLHPLKLAMENARRWLLTIFGAALAPTDHDYDADACSRTLLALLHAPGTLQFEDDTVYVTIDLQLPPTAHARLARALEALDARNLKFTDRLRNVRFRLAERPSREKLQEMMSSKK